MLNRNDFKNRFNQYYVKTYNRKINGNVAFKDIVGQEYEVFRKDLWTDFHLTVSRNQNICDYNADLIIKNSNNDIVAIEECKGHYVDICFLERFYSNAAKVINQCILSNLNVPYIILSCPTNSKAYENKKENLISLYREDIAVHLREKIKFVSLCTHDRVSKKKYFASNINDCFILDNNKIDDNIELMKKVAGL
jgi:hypothetical protein